MKQKYLISKDDEKNELTIKEFAETDKDIFSFQCEETFDSEIIKSAVSDSKPVLISRFRTKNMYPCELYANKIADSIIDLFSSESGQSIELFFDDKDYFVKEEDVELINVVESEEIEIDNLLDDTSGEDLIENNDLKKITPIINLAGKISTDTDDQ